MNKKNVLSIEFEPSVVHTPITHNGISFKFYDYYELGYLGTYKNLILHGVNLIFEYEYRELEYHDFGFEN